MDDIRLGTLLLEGGIVDEAGLERCLAIQALTNHGRPIGQILVDQGMISPDALQRALQLQQERRQASASSVRADDLAADALLTLAASEGAAELVVSEGRRACIRTGMQWRPVTDTPLSGPEVWDFARAVMGDGVLEALAERHCVVQPWHASGAGHGLATAFRQLEGVAVRIAFTPEAVPDPGMAGVSPAIVEAVRGGKGLVLLVGERGLLRAETVASLLPVAAADQAQYVVVVDDEPLPLPADRALVVRRRFGLTPAARAEALRAAVAEDPDALVVADIGDPATFEIALRAAEGGRLVIAWLDAANAAQALARLLGFPSTHDAARVRGTLAAALRAVLVRQQLPDATGTGTVAASELLVVDAAVRDAIRAGKLGDIALLVRAEGRNGGHSLDRSMLDLVAAGRVRLEDVFSRAEERLWLLDRTREMQAKAN